MYLVVIAWLYVALLMAVAEATSHTGTVFGAIITFFLYGLLPVGLMVYLMGTPLRRKARQAQERQAQAEAASSAGRAGPIGSPGPSDAAPDEGRHAAAATEASGIAPVREKP